MKLVELKSKEQRWWDDINRARANLGARALSRKEFLEHNRVIEDEMDPIRYILVVAFGAKHLLFHRVEDASFCSHISKATLFKREAAAEAVRKSMEHPKTRSLVRVVPVKKVKTGVRLVNKIS
jgi:hypothetical protein